MPAVTLTFRLPEEESEMRAAMNGQNTLFTLEEADNHLRSFIKYREGQSADALQLAEEVREILREAMPR